MKIIFKKSFDKQKKKLPLKIRNQLTKRLLLFIESPFNTLLHNHSLQGHYSGYRSINITGDYRAIFTELSEGRYEFVEFSKIGTHSELY